MFNSRIYFRQYTFSLSKCFLYVFSLLRPFEFIYRRLTPSSLLPEEICSGTDIRYDIQLSPFVVLFYHIASYFCLHCLAFYSSKISSTKRLVVARWGVCPKILFSRWRTVQISTKKKFQSSIFGALCPNNIWLELFAKKCLVAFLVSFPFFQDILSSFRVLHERLTATI